MSPRLFLVLLFIILPLAEIFVLAEVGAALGGVLTVALVVFSAVLGALLLRHQGFYTLRQVRASLDRGEPPALPMLEGGVLVLAAVLLLVPGFITDIVGLALLITPLRRTLVKGFLRRVLVARPGRGGPPPGPGESPRTLEGEYRRED